MDGIVNRKDMDDGRAGTIEVPVLKKRLYWLLVGWNLRDVHISRDNNGVSYVR